MKKTLIIIGSSLFLTILVGGRNKESGNNFATEMDSLPGNKPDDKKCMDCHAALYEKTIKHFAVEREKGCASCHNSNGNEHPKAGVTAFSLVEQPPGLCFTCHLKIKNDIANSRVVHYGAVNEKKSCLNCHVPHSSDEKKLLIATRKETCLSCHNKTVQVTTGTKTQTLSNMEQLYKNKTIHPPFQKCSRNCHNPHASDNHRMLNKFYSDEEYISPNKETFDLICYDCHNSEKFSDSLTATKTYFRNGDRNLHYVHVYKDKGRNCTLCHNVHSTNNEHLIKEAVKFGEFYFKLNYKSDEIGGSCFPGCHVERKYNRLILNPDSVPNFGK